MNVNILASYLGDACYGFLTINFLWGLYNVVLAWRSLSRLCLDNEQEQVQFVGEVERELNAGDFHAAAELCRDDERALPILTQTALANRHLNFEQLHQLVAELMHGKVMAPLEHRMSWIATVIKSGPLLGLFGTVLGMMAAFGRIGTGEKVQPSQIAHEISVALICTAMGLATAIPFSYLLASLNIRTRLLQESLDAGLTRILDCLRGLLAEAPQR